MTDKLDAQEPENLAVEEAAVPDTANVVTEPGAPVVEEASDAAELAQALARAESEINGLPAEPAAPVAAEPVVSGEQAVAAEPVTVADVAGPAVAMQPEQTMLSESVPVGMQTEQTAVAPATDLPVGEAAGLPQQPQEPGAHIGAVGADAVELPRAEQDFNYEPLPSAGAHSEPQLAAGENAQEVVATGTAAAVAPEQTQPAAAGISAAGEGIMIRPDHPMAAFYVEAPVAPEKKGNRLAGLFITLLATVVFAAVYAGVLLLTLAPTHTPQNILSDGLVPYLIAPGFYLAVIAFALSLLLTVMIFGRCGWWAYVLSSFLVGAVTWAVAALGFGLSGDLLPNDLSVRALLTLDMKAVVAYVQLAQNWIVIFAGLVAREVTVWFGAWIGARGRKVTAKNKAAQAEYEAALAAAGS